MVHSFRPKHSFPLVRERRNTSVVKPLGSSLRTTPVNTTNESVSYSYENNAYSPTVVTNIIESLQEHLHLSSI